MPDARSNSVTPEGSVSQDGGNDVWCPRREVYHPAEVRPIHAFTLGDLSQASCLPGFQRGHQTAWRGKEYSLQLRCLQEESDARHS